MSQITVSQITAGQIRASQIRASQIRATEISSNHHELHGAIFLQVEVGKIPVLFTRECVQPPCRAQNTSRTSMRDQSLLFLELRGRTTNNTQSVSCVEWSQNCAACNFYTRTGTKRKTHTALANPCCARKHQTSPLWCVSVTSAQNDLDLKECCSRFARNWRGPGSLPGSGVTFLKLQHDIARSPNPWSIPRTASSKACPILSWTKHKVNGNQAWPQNSNEQRGCTRETRRNCLTTRKQRKDPDASLTMMSREGTPKDRSSWVSMTEPVGGFRRVAIIQLQCSPSPNTNSCRRDWLRHWRCVSSCIETSRNSSSELQLLSRAGYVQRRYYACFYLSYLRI